MAGGNEDVSDRERGLEELASDLLSGDQCTRLDAISIASPFDLEALSDLDDSVPGPSMRRLRAATEQLRSFSSPGHDTLSLADRDVFRPLQYCAAAFESRDLEWRTREVVERSGLHLEALVKRMGFLTRMPLGMGVRRLKKQLGPIAGPLERYAELQNDAKHQFDHEFGTHMFSVKDAVLAYMCSRALGLALYPHAHLKSEWLFAIAADIIADH